MNLTDVKIYLVDNADPLKAFVRVIVDDCFLIRDIKVIDGRKGYFVAMPSRRDKSGNFRDIVHPINRETREWFEQQILDAYNDYVDSGGEPIPVDGDDTYTDD